MANYRDLRNLIRTAAGTGQTLTFWTGTVTSVQGATCTVDVGNMEISGVRLRASETETKDEFLITPAIGSAVIVGSLSGDYSSLAVLKCDKIENIAIRSLLREKEKQTYFKLNISVSGRSVSVENGNVTVMNGDVKGKDIFSEKNIGLNTVIEKLNNLISTYNNHIHSVPNGTSERPELTVEELE